MKLIENSIDGAILLTSVSQAELEKDMASCDSLKLNRENIIEENSMGKKDSEVKMKKLTNGVHENIEKHCNGPVNGYFDTNTEEDYQLVLENSDDEGSSVKKIDDDAISAPLIVQEIENLLGIDASAVGTDDELDKDLANLDSADSIDLSDQENLVNGECVVNESQESQESQDNLKESYFGQKDENLYERKYSEDIAINNLPEVVEDDLSSNINSVIDEIKVSCKDRETSVGENSEEPCKSKPETRATVLEEDCKVINALTVSETNGKEVDKNEEKTQFSEPLQIKRICEARKSTTEEETNLPAMIGSTESVFEWTVLDSVESSEDEGQEKNEEVLIAEDVEKSNPSIGSGSDVVEVNSKENICSSAESKEDVLRKRSTSLDEESNHSKKPKLFGKMETNYSSLQNLKRPSSDELDENHIKRSKLEVDSKLKVVDIEGKISCKKIDNDSENIEVLLNNEKRDDLLVEIVNNDEHTNKDIDQETRDEAIISNNVQKLSSSEHKESSELSQLIKTSNEEEETSKIPKTHTASFVELSVRENHTGEPPEKSQMVKDNVKECEDNVKSDEFTKHSQLIEDCVQTFPSISQLVKNTEEDTSSNKSEIMDSNVEEVSSKPQPEKTNGEFPENFLLTEKTKENPLITKLVINTDDKCSEIIKIASSEIAKSEFSLEQNAVTKMPAEIKDSKVKSDKELSTSTSDNKENIVGRCGAKSSAGSSNKNVVLNNNSDKKLGEKAKSKVAMEQISKEDDVTSKCPSKNTFFPEVIPVDVNEILKQDKCKPLNLDEKAQKPSNKNSPFGLLKKCFEEKATKDKKDTNLNHSIKHGVEKARNGLPILKQFHRSQIKNFTRSGLEEALVLKICEAITDRSELGQLRLRCKALEESTEMWRKKAIQFEKQNRELDMVLKRFMNDTAQMKEENQEKIILPIKVTRSVGLQVVLASSMNGSLQASKKMELETLNKHRQHQQTQQQQLQKQQQTDHHRRGEANDHQVKAAATFTPPVQKPKGPGRPSKSSALSNTQSPAKPSPPAATPLKTIAPKTTTPSKDLEVIDLTEAKTSPQSTVGKGIKVSPSTQVCIVQSSTPTTTPQQMAYFVQKAGPRQQQYIVATTTPSPSKSTVPVVSRPPPALALPNIFQLQPLKTRPQLVSVNSATMRANTPVISTASRQAPQPVMTAATSVRQLPQAVRLSSQVSMLKHPAPLPAAPQVAAKPGLKNPPTKPQLKIAKTINGIMLSWSMTLTRDMADMASYQLYAYQESSQTPTTSLWKRVGDVKALPLPMACTLTQFVDGHKYHFAVRAVDVHGRVGPFSQPNSILLTR